MKKLQAKHIDDRAVLSLVHHFVESQGLDCSGAGWEMVKLGVPGKLAYSKLDKQPGLMFGTSLMSCFWDYPKEKDPAWLKLKKLGGPLPIDEARQLIREAVENKDTLDKPK